VFPVRVREILCRHPAVADAAVRLMRPQEGTRLKAFIVPKDPRLADASLLSELTAWIDGELTAPERPKALRLGPQLPVSTVGKLADWPVQD
jgi:long-chain acyl-CoA synthetase